MAKCNRESFITWIKSKGRVPDTQCTNQGFTDRNSTSDLAMEISTENKQAEMVDILRNGKENTSLKIQDLTDFLISEKPNALTNIKKSSMGA